MPIESIRITLRDERAFDIPADKALVIDEHNPFIVGLVVHKLISEHPQTPHVFIGTGVLWNRDRIHDDDATFIHIFPGQTVGEAIRLHEVEESTIPASGIEFVYGKNGKSEQ